MLPALNATESPPPDAVAVFNPPAGPRVQEAWAIPSGPVSTLDGLIVPSAALAPKVTATPGTPLPNSSSTRMRSGCARVTPGLATWLLPLMMTMLVGSSATPVAVKVTAGRPGEAATTVCTPALVPSFQVTIAWPSTLLTTVALEREPPPLATVKVTGTPCLGLSTASATMTTRLAPRFAPTVPLWLFPLLTRSCEAGAVVACSVKSTGGWFPTLAETVWAPRELPRRKIACPRPTSSVDVEAETKEPPPPRTSQMMATPGTATPFWSTALITRGEAAVAPTGAA